MMDSQVVDVRIALAKDKLQHACMQQKYEWERGRKSSNLKGVDSLRYSSPVFNKDPDLTS